MSSNTSTQKKKSRKISSNSPEMAIDILTNEKVPLQYWLELCFVLSIQSSYC